MTAEEQLAYEKASAQGLAVRPIVGLHAQDILNRIIARRVAAVRDRVAAPIVVGDFVLVTEVNDMSLFFDWIMVRVSSVGENSFGYNLSAHQETQEWFGLSKESTFMFNSITAVFKDLATANEAKDRLVAISDEMQPLIDLIKVVSRVFPTSFDSEHDMVIADNILSETRAYLAETKKARQRWGSIMKLFDEGEN